MLQKRELGLCKVICPTSNTLKAVRVVFKSGSLIPLYCAQSM